MFVSLNLAVEAIRSLMNRTEAHLFSLVSDLRQHEVNIHGHSLNSFVKKQWVE